MDSKRLANLLFRNFDNPDKIKRLFEKNDENLGVYSKQVAAAICFYFKNPALSGRELMQKLKIDLIKLKAIHKKLRQLRSFQLLLISDYYPLAIMVRYAREIIAKTVKDNGYFNRIINCKPVSPDMLEVHVTYGTCNQFCRMCIWRTGKKEAEYRKSEKKKGIISIKVWNKTIRQARKLGTKTIIFSGGGEPSLREESWQVLSLTKRLGLKIIVYTNGLLLKQLAKKKSRLYEKYLESDWLRISLHAATDKTFRVITGSLSPVSLGIDEVINGIKQLVKDRNKIKGRLKIGIGFVIQPLNFRETLKIVGLAERLKIDFLNLRVDCVSMTKKLKRIELNQLYRQLKIVRREYLNGKYGRLFIDFADVLIAKMNGWKKNFAPKQPKFCRLNIFRSAINPFGRFAICDLMAEPHYSCRRFTLGIIGEENYSSIIKKSAGRLFPVNRCRFCMPGQKSVNAVLEKLIEDAKIGITPKNQFLKPTFKEIELI